MAAATRTSRSPLGSRRPRTTTEPHLPPGDRQRRRRRGGDRGGLPASSPPSRSSTTCSTRRRGAGRPVAAVEVGAGRRPTARIGLGTDVGGLAICYRGTCSKRPACRPSVTGRRCGRTGTSTSRRQDSRPRSPARRSSTGRGCSTRSSGSRPTASTTRGQHDRGQQPGRQGGLGPDRRRRSRPGCRRTSPLPTQWSTGFARAFATIACPAWMMAYIQEARPRRRRVGRGRGSRRRRQLGRLWLAVPKQSDHPEEAYELAAWLTAPEQQAKCSGRRATCPRRSSCTRTRR